MRPSIAIGAGCIAVAVACGGAPRSPRMGDATALPAADSPRPELTATEGLAVVDRIDPELLLPDQDSDDDLIARVGEFEIRKRHVYEHLVQTEPAAPRRLVDVIVLDAEVARAARLWGISLEREAVQRLADDQENALRTEVERQLGDHLTFGRYLQRQFGMTEREYRNWLHTKLVRELYRQLVLRYAALREDRVEVRYIVNADAKVLEDVAARVRQGASFSTLAIRHTEDENRMDGGLLPPFGKGFDHPVADVAFDLPEGGLSDVIMREVQGAKRYYLVYCLRHLPGRDVPFESVRAELEQAIDERPLTPMEFRAASVSLRTMIAESARRSPPNGR